MNSLNEENNTRVLFERVLTTCSLPAEETIDIWNCFLEFEAGIGDLSSIAKVERRRMTALEKFFPRCTDTSWSIDKYTFQDLYPCSLTELRCLGYDAAQVATSMTSVRRNMPFAGAFSSSTSNNQQIGSVSAPSLRKLKQSSGRNSNTKTLSEQTEELFDQVEGDGDFTLSALNHNEPCLPDLDQMLPFKPVMAPGFGAHTVPGGVFPPPPAIGNLLTRLPQAGSFWGPFVDIDELANIIRVSDFDELFNNLVEQRRLESSNKPTRSKRIRTE